ncbi:hypothetical protein OS493_018848 [Desmophyllum pertusum]|uniref:Uncharacterized protein n=1 Tax=Desmophyllum pertusum TaxID=174260 RepID=A0A9W9ZC57_9CNID|nr:hypothetical protein OS493_018848 [Desmophyllum pertusum]
MVLLLFPPLIRAGKYQVCVQKWLKLDIKTNRYPPVPGATGLFIITVLANKAISNQGLIDLECSRNKKLINYIGLYFYSKGPLPYPASTSLLIHQSNLPIY